MWAAIVALAQAVYQAYQIFTGGTPEQQISRVFDDLQFFEDEVFHWMANLQGEIEALAAAFARQVSTDAIVKAGWYL